MEQEISKAIESLLAIISRERWAGQKTELESYTEGLFDGAERMRKAVEQAMKRKD